MSRVRSALASASGTVTGGPAGYRLDVDAGQLDVTVVADLRRRARIATLAEDDHGAAHLLERARALWRGEPEIPATHAGDAQRARLAEEHLLLTEDHLAALVSAGSAAHALGELEALTAAHPLRERVWGLRMEALYRCGRQADALAAYRSVRRRLRDELGVEPGPALRALESAVLGHTLPAPGTGVPASGSPLPSDVPRYAETGGAHIAYGVFGDGGAAASADVLLLNPTFIPVDAYLEEPHLAAAVRGLARGRRVLAMDRRGLGLSDPLPPGLAQWTADAVAVLDACGAGRVDVLANADTTMLALRLAATHPDRVASLTLVNGYARPTRTDGYPYGDPETIGDTLAEIRTTARRPRVDVLSWIAPSVADDPRFRAWWDAAGRRGASPGAAAAFHRMLLAADVRDVLPRVIAPVLVVSRLGCASYDPGHGRHLAAHLPDARLVEYPDPDGPWFLGDTDRVLAEFRSFTCP